MFIYTTGDLLQSDAQALVNTVNCEGFMGKGIAYQFKLQYPDNFKEYQKACKNGSLRPGVLLPYSERNKLIINFPTKDKWRNPSKIEYIESGLDALIELISKLRIESIAIPPLGSGNGGLVWSQVRQLVETKLSRLELTTKIIIYEPSKAYSSRPVQEPKLSTSALVLMDIKQQLSIFNKLRLQKAAYFTNIFLHKAYFKFEKHQYGPYNYAIDLISKDIKAYQSFHELKSTAQARDILYKKIISKSVDSKLSELSSAIKRACDFVNGVTTDHELECLATVCFIVERNYGISSKSIVNEFLAWSEDKASRFNESEIIAAINTLYDAEIFEKSLEGFVLMNPITKHE